MQDSGYAARTCAVEGCGKPAKRVSKYFDRYCSMHRARVTRHGSPNIVHEPALTPFVHTNGYVLRSERDHQLAMKGGMVYVHRAVLYDHIGDGAHACHWCGAEIRWGRIGAADELVPDHLDNTRTNNSRENLVASCRACNSRRGNLGRRAPNRLDLDLGTIHALADAGLSKAEIGRRLGIGESVIRRRLKERG